MCKKAKYRKCQVRKHDRCNRLTTFAWVSEDKAQVGNNVELTIVVGPTDRLWEIIDVTDIVKSA